LKSFPYFYKKNTIAFRKDSNKIGLITIDKVRLG
jgi:hypothetical protein